jgi:4-amino-4-deoxy-L-arabinose transferase-like glycosyltransferase
MTLTKNYNRIMHSKRGMIILLFFISFIIRITFLILVANADVPLFGDEKLYFSISISFEKIIRCISQGHLPSIGTLAGAYKGGIWPPFHPILLALGLFLFGKQVAVARFVVVMLSSLTTPLVYLVTSRLTTKKAAIVASLIHIFYPSFIAFSHYLWSETTFIFILLLSLYFTILLPNVQYDRRRFLYATLTGFFLGLCALTRPAGLPFLIVVPLWLVFSLKETRLRILIPSIVILLSLIVLLPWQSALTLVEQRFVILSSKGGKALYMGNNPWVPDEYGYTGKFAPNKFALLKETMEEYSETNSVTVDEAARTLALQEIKGNFRQFLVRCFYRLRMLWAGDFFAMRHIFHTVYPPLHHAIVVLIWIIILTSYFILIALATWGFLSTGMQFINKALMLALVIAGMVGPVIMVAVSRYHLPLLALLLPFAGHGAVNLRRRTSLRRAIAMMLITILFFVFAFTSLPLITGSYLIPSSYYYSVIRRADSILGSNASFIDRIMFRAKDANSTDHLNITIQNEDYVFNDSQTQQYRWAISPKYRDLALDIYSHEATAPLDIALFSEKFSQSVVIRPIQKNFWRQWRPTGIDGIEYMWSGGGKTYPGE